MLFDEAHNIDDICVEAYTVRLHKGVIQMASQNIEYLQNNINQLA